MLLLLSSKTNTTRHRSTQSTKLPFSSEFLLPSQFNDNVMSTITTDQFLAAAKHRRSVYGLKDTSPVPDSRIEEIVKEVLSFSPSSFNTQPDRITIVLGEKHKELWQVIIDAARPILEAAGPLIWEAMGPRFEGHKSAYGSVWQSPFLPS